MSHENYNNFFTNDWAVFWYHDCITSNDIEVMTTYQNLSAGNWFQQQPLNNEGDIVWTFDLN